MHRGILAYQPQRGKLTAIQEHNKLYFYQLFSNGPYQNLIDSYKINDMIFYCFLFSALLLISTLSIYPFGCCVYISDSRPHILFQLSGLFLFKGYVLEKNKKKFSYLKVEEMHVTSYAEYHFPHCQSWKHLNFLSHMLAVFQTPEFVSHVTVVILCYTNKRTQLFCRSLECTFSSLST